MSAKEKLDFIEKAYKEGNMPIWDYEKYKEEFREKTAKEMFEELGFELQFGGIYKHKETGKRICFDEYEGGYLDVMEIDLISLDLLQAINKQVEELGWNK